MAMQGGHNVDLLCLLTVWLIATCLYFLFILLITTEYLIEGRFFDLLLHLYLLITTNYLIEGGLTFVRKFHLQFCEYGIFQSLFVRTAKYKLTALLALTRQYYVQRHLCFGIRSLLSLLVFARALVSVKLYSVTRSFKNGCWYCFWYFADRNIRNARCEGQKRFRKFRVPSGQDVIQTSFFNLTLRLSFVFWTSDLNLNSVQFELWCHNVRCKSQCGSKLPTLTFWIIVDFEDACRSAQKSAHRS